MEKFHRYCLQNENKQIQHHNTMNCPKCNNPVREGAKFCTSCGNRIETAQASSVCPECSSPIKEGAKFCTACGHKLNVPKSEIHADSMKEQDISSVKGRIYWNIRPGQIARIINESEFDSYDNPKGIIINEGTTAYIRANGHTIASISGGSYDFTGPAASTGILAGIRQSWNIILNMFRKKKDNVKDTEEEQLYRKQQDIILENAKRGAAFSIIILLDKSFPLVLGSEKEKADDPGNFVPMEVRTRYMNLSLGFNAYFRITEHENFITHYLTGKQRLGNADIASEICKPVKNLLEDYLYEMELEGGRIPNSLYPALKERINESAADIFFGLSLVRIVEISSSDTDLERFRDLSREMYLSEKELDYLERTNEFKNRLFEAMGNQRIHEAASELDIDRKLEEINKDRLLDENEIEKFRHFLENERIVALAKNDDEREAALLEISKSGLLRNDEIEELQHMIETNRYKRGAALEMVKLHDAIEYERIRTEGNMENAKLEVIKALEIQGLQDDYQDTLFYKDLERRRKTAETELDLEQRRRDMDFNDMKRRHDMEREDDDAQFRQFLEMKKAEEESLENQRRHESRMEEARLKSAEEMERLKWENARNLSEEQVWALKGGDAAVAYAQSKYNAEAEKASRERLDAYRREADARLDAERKDNQDFMRQMMRDVMAMAGGMQQQRAEDSERRYREQIEEKDRQIKEKDDRIMRQEGRMDTAYDRALDYTTRDNRNGQEQPRNGSNFVKINITDKKSGGMTCPDCGASVEEGCRFCPDCGKDMLQ